MLVLETKCVIFYISKLISVILVQNMSSFHLGFFFFPICHLIFSFLALKTLRKVTKVHLLGFRSDAIKVLCYF